MVSVHLDRLHRLGGIDNSRIVVAHNGRMGWTERGVETMNRLWFLFILVFVLLASQNSAQLLPDLAPSISDQGSYGSGEHGEIQRSGEYLEYGVVQSTNYTVTAGTIVSTRGHHVYVFASNRITIHGSIDVGGLGAAGGVPGYAGEPGYGIPGSPGNENGGGGSGIPAPAEVYEFLRDPTGYPNAYGSGGGGGGICDQRLTSAGGGGGSTPARSGGRGGDAGPTGEYQQNKPGAGGNGGGSIFLHAPTIEISRNAVLDASGAPGENGSGNCGAGGGGSGGIVYLTYQNLILEGSINVQGGRGGSTVNQNSQTLDSQYAGRTAPVGGGEGGTGASGHIFKVQS